MTAVPSARNGNRCAGSKRTVPFRKKRWACGKSSVGFTSGPQRRAGLRLVVVQVVQECRAASGAVAAGRRGGAGASASGGRRGVATGAGDVAGCGGCWSG